MREKIVKEVKKGRVLGPFEALPLPIYEFHVWGCCLRRHRVSFGSFTIDHSQMVLW